MEEQWSVISGQLSEDEDLSVDGGLDSGDGIQNPKSKIQNENLPASRKTYVETNGSTVNQNRHNLRVPFREIVLGPSKNFDGTIEENAPVRVYDTSGVWTDPDMKC